MFVASGRVKNNKHKNQAWHRIIPPSRHEYWNHLIDKPSVILSQFDIGRPSYCLMCENKIECWMIFKSAERETLTHSKLNFFRLLDSLLWEINFAIRSSQLNGESKKEKFR